MRTKEAVLQATMDKFEGVKFDNPIVVLAAMDEYAKESSLDFAKWLNDNCIVATGGQWRHHNKWIQVKNTDELYEMYLQEKSSLK